jgi:hypothetical protein
VSELFFEVMFDLCILIERQSSRHLRYNDTWRVSINKTKIHLRIMMEMDNGNLYSFVKQKGWI